MFLLTFFDGLSFSDEKIPSKRGKEARRREANEGRDLGETGRGHSSLGALGETSGGEATGRRGDASVECTTAATPACLSPAFQPRFSSLPNSYSGPGATRVHVCELCIIRTYSNRMHLCNGDD